MKYTTEMFIEKATKIHNGRYDYRLVEYINNSSPVKIICKEHGIFEQTPHGHLSGRGCRLCGNKKSPKYTTETFIEKANQVHNGRYDYTKSIYQGTEKLIKIICKEHGEFEQLPKHHLARQGCPLCAHKKHQEKLRYTTELYIEKARAIHNNRYDYSKTVYKSSSEQVLIICNNCKREFYLTARGHLQGIGCSKCYKFQPKKSSPKKDLVTNLESFIEKATQIHKGFYDYTESIYNGTHKKLKIICKVHGTFEQSPHDHLKGKGCSLCANIISGKKRTLTLEEFIEKAHAIHKGKYDYSLVHYNNVRTPVNIVCKEHGVFSQLPILHLQGSGCQECARIYNSESKKYSQQEFIEKAQTVHNDKYDYSKLQYTSARETVTIICKEHGEFKQIASNHLRGWGCPKCRQSRGEIMISNWLTTHNIKYEYQKRYTDLGNLSYDFYVPKYNLLIEYNGGQHYKFNEFFHTDIHDFHYQKHRDWIKRKYAKEHNIHLLTIPYWEFNNIQDILSNEIYN